MQGSIYDHMSQDPKAIDWKKLVHWWRDNEAEFLKKPTEGLPATALPRASLLSHVPCHRWPWQPGVERKGGGHRGGCGAHDRARTTAQSRRNKVSGA